MLTILHGSDLHLGKRFKPEAADAFQKSIRALDPDLLVLSGDFTQRAKLREYQQARDYLRSLPDLPVVVTPGNHDVPLYRFWERLLAPLRNYREFISPELDTVTVVPGATVVSPPITLDRITDSKSRNTTDRSAKSTDTNPGLGHESSPLPST